jgi:hypothetical protein
MLPLAIVNCVLATAIRVMPHAGRLRKQVIVRASVTRSVVMRGLSDQPITFRSNRPGTDGMLAQRVAVHAKLLRRRKSRFASLHTLDRQFLELCRVPLREFFIYCPSKATSILRHLWKTKFRGKSHQLFQ